MEGVIAMDVPEWQLQLLQLSAYLGNNKPSASSPTPTPVDPLVVPSSSSPSPSPSPSPPQQPVRILSLSSPDDTPPDPDTLVPETEFSPEGLDSASPIPSPSGSDPDAAAPMPTRKLAGRLRARWRVAFRSSPEGPPDPDPFQGFRYVRRAASVSASAAASASASASAAASTPPPAPAEPSAPADPVPGEERPRAACAVEILQVLKDYGGHDPEFPRDVFDVMRALAAANKKRAPEGVDVLEAARAKTIEFEWRHGK